MYIMCVMYILCGLWSIRSILCILCGLWSIRSILCFKCVMYIMRVMNNMFLMCFRYMMWFMEY
jgi:hypothetical protein